MYNLSLKRVNSFAAVAFVTCLACLLSFPPWLAFTLALAFLKAFQSRSAIEQAAENHQVY